MCDYCLFELTWGCNLNCDMCPRNLFGTTGSKLEMPYDKFIHVLNCIPELKQANLAGLGEPLFYSHIWEAFKEFEKRRINILMTSNGTLWTEDNIKKLPKVRMQVHFSIDSPNPDIFKKLRHCDLEPILDNLRLLHKERPDINIVIQALYMKPTMDTFVDFIPIAKELNAMIACLYPISFQKEDEDKYEPFMEENFEKNKIEFSNKCATEGVRIHDRPTQPVSKPCSEPWMGPMINPKGEIFPCCYVYEGRHYDKTPDTWDEWYLGHKITVPQSNYIIGNAFTDDVKNVWDNSSKLRDLQKFVSLCNSVQLNPKEYKKLRNDVNMNRNQFSYCRVCLWRHNQSC